MMVLPRGISFRASFGTTPMPAGLRCRSTLRSTFTPNGPRWAFKRRGPCVPPTYQVQTAPSASTSGSQMETCTCSALDVSVARGEAAVRAFGPGLQVHAQARAWGVQHQRQEDLWSVLTLELWILAPLLACSSAPCATVASIFTPAARQTRMSVAAFAVGAAVPTATRRLFRGWCGGRSVHKNRSAPVFSSDSLLAETVQRLSVSFERVLEDGVRQPLYRVEGVSAALAPVGLHGEYAKRLETKMHNIRRGGLKELADAVYTVDDASDKIICYQPTSTDFLGDKYQCSEAGRDDGAPPGHLLPSVLRDHTHARRTEVNTHQGARLGKFLYQYCQTRSRSPSWR